MSTQRNKVHHVHTVAWVARKLDVDEDLIHDLTLGMEPEDGVIWVYGVDSDDGVMAFTDEGIEEVRLILEECREPAGATRQPSDVSAAFAGGIPLRGIAIGRKAWLFAGSGRRGERAAAIYSLIVTACLNNVYPRAWLADTLRRIANHPAQRLHELLPWNYPSTPRTEQTAA